MAHTNPAPMPAKVPTGKEGEYIEDERTGELIHTGYGTDPEFEGVVLPTARVEQVIDPKTKRAGFCPTMRSTFDANNPNIVQNIVDTTNGHTVIEQVDLGAKKAASANLQKHVEDRPAPAPVGNALLASVMAKAEKEGLMGSTRMSKKQAKKKRTKSTPTKKKVAVKKPKRAAPPPPEPELDEYEDDEELMEPEFQPTQVAITGAFGTISQLFHGVFRDGMCLVLVTDNSANYPKYELPPVGDDPVMMGIGWGGQKVEALWAGIKFTVPNGSVTFHVLLIPEVADAMAGQAAPETPPFM